MFSVDIGKFYENAKINFISNLIIEFLHNTSRFIDIFLCNYSKFKVNRLLVEILEETSWNVY